MTEGYFTMGDLERAIEDSFLVSLNETERNELLKKINSTYNKLVVRKITPEKVMEQGTFTDEFTQKDSSDSFYCQLPMDFVKENHLYYPTFFNTNTLMVGIEVIIPVGNSRGNVKGNSRGALCYLQTRKNGKMRLCIAAIKNNGWGRFGKEDSGIYVLNLGRANTVFLNWNQNPFKNK